ncbi:MAG TPA: acyltransferase [Gemmatimonadales bacterium]|nr:acyltransferase [Gemmatimonadales bacterium]
MALDALRALAVLLVIGRHLRIPYSLLPTSPTRIFAELWQRGGWIGVDLFFVLSGFLVSGLLFREHQQYKKVSLGRFFVRRGLKIYPAFYVFLLGTVALRLAWGRRLEPSQILAEVFFVQNYVHGVWNHTWSLAIEEHFYILLPLLLLLLLKRCRDRVDPYAALPMICGALMLALLGLRIWNAATVPFDTATHVFPTHLRIDSLMFGVLLSYWFHYHRDRFRSVVMRNRAALTVLGVALLLPAFVADLSTEPWLYTAGFTALALGSGALLATALHAPELVKKLLAPAAKVGAYSYSIYLWHLPILGYFLTWVEGTLGMRLPWWPRTLLGVTACIVFGIGISQLIEYRVLKFRDRMFPSRSRPLEPPALREQPRLRHANLPALTE